MDPSGVSYPSQSAYNYVLNNPLGATDPDGRDVALLNDRSGAAGAGHNAVVVGNDNDGWVYYSKDGPGKYTRSEYKTFKSSEIQMMPKDMMRLLGL